jgi:Amt family ammonium transporter
MSANPVEYNGTIATGGDSLTEDLNIFYDVRSYIQPILYCQ